MSCPYGSGRSGSITFGSLDLFDPINSPGGTSPSKTHQQSHNSLVTSPLFTSSSLPTRTMSRDGCKSDSLPLNKDFKFVNFDMATCHRSYPSVIVNGAIADVNDIVTEIVKRRPQLINRSFKHCDISYVCPYSQAPITCPVRGAECSHAQCFDLREFLIGQENEKWMCPICQVPLSVDTITFDPFYFAPYAYDSAIPKAEVPQVDDIWNTESSIFDRNFGQF